MQWPDRCSRKPSRLPGLADIASSLRVEKSGGELAKEIATIVSKRVKARVGALYLTDTSGALKLAGSYAFSRRKRHETVIEDEAGLVAQAVYEKQLLVIDEAPPGYLTVASGLGEADAASVLVYPLVYGDEVLRGVTAPGERGLTSMASGVFGTSSTVSRASACSS